MLGERISQQRLVRCCAAVILVAFELTRQFNQDSGRLGMIRIALHKIAQGGDGPRAVVGKALRLGLAQPRAGPGRVVRVGSEQAVPGLQCARIVFQPLVRTRDQSQGFAAPLTGLTVQKSVEGIDRRLVGGVVVVYLSTGKRIHRQVVVHQADQSLIGVTAARSQGDGVAPVLLGGGLLTHVPGCVTGQRVYFSLVRCILCDGQDRLILCQRAGMIRARRRIRGPLFTRGQRQHAARRSAHGGLIRRRRGRRILQSGRHFRQTPVHIIRQPGRTALQIGLIGAARTFPFLQRLVRLAQVEVRGGAARVRACAAQKILESRDGLAVEAVCLVTFAQSKGCVSRLWICRRLGQKADESRAGRGVIPVALLAQALAQQVGRGKRRRCIRRRGCRRQRQRRGQ